MISIRKKIILTFLLLSVFFFLGSGFILAVDVPDYCQQTQIPTDKVNECISILTDKGNELKTQANTLSSQIAIMNNQIKLTEFRIKATQEQITSITLDIDTATKKISSLQKSLDDSITVLLNRIVATYQVGTIQPLQILLTSGSASDFFSRLNYLKLAQAHDKKLIYQMQQAKVDYANQKEIFEDQKKKVVALKAQLEEYTNQLEQERKNKQILLDVTKNDGVRYQKLLAQAQAELAIAFGGGSEKLIRSVKQGDVVGTIISGSSGCSSGSHLHFEVHKNGSIDDASVYLQPKSFTYKDSEGEVGTVNPRGPYPWPLDDPIYITQGYGMTPYAQTGAYRSNGVNLPHYGIDMGSNSSLSVKAVRDGELYGGSISCGGKYPGTLFYARIKHGDGIDTLYLHIYPN